jgi:hypothetical protein
MYNIFVILTMLYALQMLTDMKYKIMRCWETQSFLIKCASYKTWNRCLKVLGSHSQSWGVGPMEKTFSKLKGVSLAKRKRACFYLGTLLWGTCLGNWHLSKWQWHLQLAWSCSQKVGWGMRCALLPSKCEIQRTKTYIIIIKEHVLFL